MYILHQRLEAQKVPDHKAKQVLVDVIKTMFSEEFLNEIFKPQRTYTPMSMKQLFQKIAHSSIMRLNARSMDKLYDLMSMAIKSQLCRILLPHQILIITLNHLETVLAMSNDPGATHLINMAIRKCIENG